MDLERFLNSSTGRLVKASYGKTTYWAFVPNLLPPEVTFDHELVYTLSEADRALGELTGLARTLLNLHHLMYGR